MLHLRIDRVERRNAFTQDMYRRHQAGRDLGRRRAELDAVCLTGTDEWFGAGGDMAGNAEDPEGLAAEWDPTDHFPFRHIERCRKLWVAKVNGVCHAGGLDLVLHCDVAVASDQRPVPRAGAAARHPRPVHVGPPGRGRRPRPGPVPVLHRGGDRRRRGGGDGPGRQGRRPRRARRRRSSGSSGDRRSTGPRRPRPRSSATSTAASRPTTSRCSTGRSAPARWWRAWRAFVEKRAAVWPRP